MSVVVVMVAVPGPCLGVSMWHCRDCLFFAGDETVDSKGNKYGTSIVISREAGRGAVKNTCQ